MLKMFLKSCCFFIPWSKAILRFLLHILFLCLRNHLGKRLPLIIEQCASLASLFKKTHKITQSWTLLGCKLSPVTITLGYVILETTTFECKFTSKSGEFWWFWIFLSSNNVSLQEPTIHKSKYWWFSHRWYMLAELDKFGPKTLWITFLGLNVA